MNSFFDECESLIPKNAMAVHNILNNKGYNTYFVGGALRDYCISKIHNKDLKIKDWDITTTARYNEMSNMFNKILRVNEGGKVVSKKGKAEVLIPDIETTAIYIDRDIFEATPMNFKKGGDVIFTNNLVEDLSTRDFTMNAIAYSPKLGTVSNFKNVNGLYIDSVDDINNKIIKTIGDPNISLRENRFNILRGLFFANKLNFKIEDETLESIRYNIFDVNYINKGKLSILFERLIMSKATDKLEYIVYTGLLESLVLDFNEKLAKEFIYNLYDLSNENKEERYEDKLKYIYNGFSNKTLLIKLYREFGVNKNIINFITEEYDTEK